MVIFVYGEDRFRVQEKVHQLRDHFCRKFPFAIENVVELYEAPHPASFAGVVRTGGLFAKERFVLCKEMVCDLSVEHAKISEGLSHDTIVVFEDAGETKDIEGTAFFQALTGKEGVFAYPFRPMTEAVFSRWARERIAAQGGVIEEAALRELILRTAQDTWRLDTEIKKLIAYAEGGTITVDYVVLLVASSFNDRLFDFLDTMSGPNKQKAVNLLANQRNVGSSDGELFSLCVRQVRLLLCTKDLLEKRPVLSQAELTRELGIHPFVAGKLSRQARNFSRARLLTLHDKAFSLDQETKQGRKDFGLALEEMLVWFTEAPGVPVPSAI
ncbi:DNA polymerase III subunit delta [Candidatus Uhrbacteria bacterium]|nr:DNA polymerase III subunit delta [Candidatus Uhrbacteria bacterium]